LVGKGSENGKGQGRRKDAADQKIPSLSKVRSRGRKRIKKDQSAQVGTGDSRPIAWIASLSCVFSYSRDLHKLGASGGSWGEGKHGSCRNGGREKIKGTSKQSPPREGPQLFFHVPSKTRDKLGRDLKKKGGRSTVREKKKKI